MEIVAEISGNHGGKIENAYRLIKTATKAGADTIKFQCFQPERLARRRANNPEVLKLANGIPLIDLYWKIHTPQEWFPSLIHAAGEHGLNWFSSVFDPTDVDFLEDLDCPRYKISAFEMLDGDLINAVVMTNKPIILSVRPTENVTILHATDYSGNEIPIGQSMHGPQLPYFDAPMVEYHLRLEGVDTPDKDFSLTGDELADKVRRIRR